MSDGMPLKGSRVAEDRTPVSVGIGLSDHPKVPELSSRQHAVLTARRALADSGMDKRDIDGYMAGDQIQPPDLAVPFWRPAR